MVGKGTFVSETATVIGDVVVGDGCYIGHGVIVRGDYGRITIGNETALEEAVVVHAPPDETALIDGEVTVGLGAIVHGSRIGSGAVIGMGAILGIHSDVGAGAIIGEGSVVVTGRIISPHCVAVGNPARVIREVSEEETLFWDRVRTEYRRLAEQYIKGKMVALCGSE